MIFEFFFNIYPYPTMLKIGALSFINALPFFIPFQLRHIDMKSYFTWGVPSEINTLLENGTIDIGLISSESFLANRDEYILLTDLGIGALHRVDSVCLHVRKGIEEIHKKRVGITKSSATSMTLLKVLCKHYWQVEPEFFMFHNQDLDEVLKEENKGILLIGDICLQKPYLDGYVRLDLAECWYKFSGKPFIFAVFATRLDAWAKYPSLVKEFHQKLEASFNWSSQHRDVIIAEAKKRIDLTNQALQTYYNLLEYHLEPTHFQGLEYFARLR